MENSSEGFVWLDYVTDIGVDEAMEGFKDNNVDFTFKIVEEPVAMQVCE